MSNKEPHATKRGPGRKHQQGAQRGPRGMSSYPKRAAKGR